MYQGTWWELLSYISPRKAVVPCIRLVHQTTPPCHLVSDERGMARTHHGSDFGRKLASTKCGAHRRPLHFQRSHRLHEQPRPLLSRPSTKRFVSFQHQCRSSIVPQYILRPSRRLSLGDLKTSNHLNPPSLPNFRKIPILPQFIFLSYSVILRNKTAAHHHHPPYRHSPPNPASTADGSPDDERMHRNRIVTPRTLRDSGWTATAAL